MRLPCRPSNVKSDMINQIWLVSVSEQRDSNSHFQRSQLYLTSPWLPQCFQDLTYLNLCAYLYTQIDNAVCGACSNVRSFAVMCSSMEPSQMAICVNRNYAVADQNTDRRGPQGDQAALCLIMCIQVHTTSACHSALVGTVQQLTTHQLPCTS